MKIFYHGADLDGWCSGALLKLKYPEADLISVNHGFPFPYELVEDQEKIFVVDFSWDINTMIDLNNKYDLIWIDHHVSIIEEIKKNNLEFNGIQKVGIGACSLVYDYLYLNDNPTPRFIKLLAEYDVFNFSDSNTLPFQFGMRIRMTDPIIDVSSWKSIISMDEELEKEIVNEGNCILKYLNQYNEKLINSLGIYTWFEGYSALAVNQGMTNSFIFDSHPKKDEFDIFISFVRRYNKWSVSLYSKHIDVSVIAKKYGGGGHKGAAGFPCQQLPFEI